MKKGVPFNKSNIGGYLLALLATFIWSGNFFIARAISGQISPITLAFLRWSLAVLVFLPFAIKPMIKEFNILKKHFKYLAISSFLGVTLFNTLIYYAGRHTNAINLSIISITFPIMIIILSRVFLKYPISKMKYVGISIVLMGALVLITKGDLSSILKLDFSSGDLLMFLSAFSFAVYSILLKFRPKEMGLMSYQLASFMLGLIFLSPFFVIDRFFGTAIEFTWPILMAILYIALFASLLAFLCWNKAIALIGPGKSGLIYYTLPLFSAISSYFILEESIRFYHYVCLIIIVTGIIIANYEKKINVNSK